MSVLLVLPVIIPAVTGILTLLARRSRMAQRVLSVVGAMALLGVSVAVLLRVQADGIQATE